MRGAGISGPGSFSVLGPAVPVSSGSIVAPDVCVGGERLYCKAVANREEEQGGAEAWTCAPACSV